MAGGKRRKTFAYVLCNLLNLVSYRSVHLVAGEVIGTRDRRQCDGDRESESRGNKDWQQSQQLDL
jgi:hypothetical protein